MQLQQLCRAQIEAGHSPLVFTRVAGEEHPEMALCESSHDGVPVVSLTNNFLDCDRFELLYTHPTIDARFREYLERSRPDLVHVHHLSCLSTTMLEVAKDLGLPVVLWLHDYWLQCLRGQRLHPVDLSICDELDRDRCLQCLRPLWPHLLPSRRRFGFLGPDRTRSLLESWEGHVRRMLAVCDATLSPSEFHRRRFLDFGMDADRSYVVTQGIPREALEAEPRGRRPVRRVGYIGMVLPSKGVHTLIEAFNLVARPELELHVYGEALPFHEKTDYGEELRAAVGKDSRVVFRGGYELSELPEILSTLDLLVVPSIWWESYCLTAREGAVGGLPVIVSDLGGLAEAVETGLAYGVAPADPVALARAIEKMCDDEELRDAFSRKADRVPEPDVSIQQIESIYASVLAGA